MRFVLAGLVWLLIAIALGATGALRHIRPPAPQLIIIGLVIALLGAYAINARFREWLWELDLRAVIALHLTRFVGFYFLYLYRKGQLPGAFAIPAGWGDIVIATSALVLMIALAIAKAIISRSGVSRARRASLRPSTDLFHQPC